MNTKKYLMLTVVTTVLVLNISEVMADTTRLFFSANKHYYQRFDKPMSWEDAKVFCEQKKAHLLTITTTAEQNFMKANLYTSSHDLWLGANDYSDGQWLWITNEKFTLSDDPVSYWSWVSGLDYMMYGSMGTYSPNYFVSDGVADSSISTVCEWDGKSSSSTGCN